MRSAPDTLLVGAHDGEGEHVEVALALVVGDAADDLGQRTRRRELVFDHRLDARLARVAQNQRALGRQQRAVGARRGHRQPDDPQHFEREARDRPAAGDRGGGRAPARSRGRRLAAPCAPAPCQAAPVAGRIACCLADVS